MMSRVIGLSYRIVAFVWAKIYISFHITKKCYSKMTKTVEIGSIISNYSKRNSKMTSVLEIIYRFARIINLTFIFVARS